MTKSEENSLEIKISDVYLATHTGWNGGTQAARAGGRGRQNRSTMTHSTQVGVVVDLFLDADQHCSVPLVQSRYAVVSFNGFGERIHVLVFKVFDQFLNTKL